MVPAAGGRSCRPERHRVRRARDTPGRGEFLKRRQGKVHIARFDLAILIETTPEAADVLKGSPAYAEMERAIREAASFTHVVTATNAKSIGPVDHERQGIFLFNYFFADDTAQNLAVWEYTAGWFQQETGLDNSTVLLPRDGERSEYNIMNHCRWDRLGDVMPSLLFKRSFRSYVAGQLRGQQRSRDAHSVPYGVRRRQGQYGRMTP